MAAESPESPRRDELPVRLTRLRVKNFRSIAELDIPLSPLTVLVGPNGSGKSNVVDALRLIRDASLRGIEAIKEGQGIMPHIAGDLHSPDISLEIEMKVFVEEKDASRQVKYGYSLSLGAEPKVREEYMSVSIGKSETLSVRREGNKATVYFGGQVYGRLINLQDALTGLDELSIFFVYTVDPEDHPLLDFSKNADYAIKAAKFLKGLKFYDFVPGDIKLPQREISEKSLSESGKNMGSVLCDIKAAKDWQYEGLCHALTSIVSEVRNYTVLRAGNYFVSSLIYDLGNGRIRISDLELESQGTLRVIALLTALYQLEAPDYMCFEEPETGIHPGALAVLAEVFQQASLHSQVLLTTHSPDLLDQLPPESFLVVEKVDGSTKVGPLSASQQETIRKKLFFPGELMRVEGLHRQEDAED